MEPLASQWFPHRRFAVWWRCLELVSSMRGYNDSAVSAPKSCAADALALPCNDSATNHLRQRPTLPLHVGQAGAVFDIGMYHPYLPVSSAASAPTRVLAAMQLL
ncbi:hypothetical protein [Xanthomonas arboricola]|uniref:hypothetical protein n=1 Tax=Xanthomonas arboricola TaxID=56448 RepID=UPI001C6139B2|nr:hypothetical protein [Xanthomonas arboricola]